MSPRYIVIDFEFREVTPGVLEIVCLVAIEVATGRVHRLWLEGVAPSNLPFEVNANTVLVAHGVAPAEARCWHQLGLPQPGGWIDTFVEARVTAAGDRPEGGFGLLACCQRFGVSSISTDEKSNMHELILQGGPYTDGQKQDILDYCESDVQETLQLFEKARVSWDMRHAMLRGKAMAAFADIADRGIPVDCKRYEAVTSLGNQGFRELWQDKLDVYGLMKNGSLCYARFAELVEQSGLPWPRTDTGRYKMKKDILKDASRAYGEPWSSVLELTRSIAEGAVDGLCQGGDGRLYAQPKAFFTITGRNAPSTSEFIFLGPKWLRSLIQAPPGRTILQLDWSAQEYAIAAALSQDEAMMAAYETGDPYLAFAKMVGALPTDATEESHPVIRGRYKVVSLAVLMGMGVARIGAQTGLGLDGGRTLFRKHQQTFSRFWEWTTSVGNTGAAGRDIETAFGLRYNPVDPGQFKVRTARNFLLQATGSDMLRVAVLLLEQAGIEVLATVHDAVLVECDTADAEEVWAMSATLMQEASRIVLWDRITVRTGSNRRDFPHQDRFDHPHHFRDKKGLGTWKKLAGHLTLELDEYER